MENTNDKQAPAASAVSIDGDSKFWSLAVAWLRAEGPAKAVPAANTLVAHIDQWSDARAEEARREADQAARKETRDYYEAKIADLFAAAQRTTGGDILDELRATVCGVRVVGEIDGHAVIRRDSVIDLIDRRRTPAASAAAPGADGLPEGWKASHLVHDPRMTAEWNATRRFMVERIEPPFRPKSGPGVWFGATLHEAISAGCKELKLPQPVEEAAAQAPSGPVTWTADDEHRLDTALHETFGTPAPEPIQAAAQVEDKPEALVEAIKRVADGAQPVPAWKDHEAAAQADDGCKTCYGVGVIGGSTLDPDDNARLCPDCPAAAPTAQPTPDATVTDCGSPVDNSAQPTLEVEVRCQQCNRNRLEEPCRRPDNCGLIATAQVTQPTPPDDERAAFEKWMREEWECTDDDLKRVNGGPYFWDTTATAWAVWKGSAALRHLPVPNVGEPAAERTRIGSAGDWYFFDGYKDLPIGTKLYTAAPNPSAEDADWRAIAEGHALQSAENAVDAERYRVLREADFSQEPTHFRRGKPWAVMLDPAQQIPTMTICRCDDLDRMCDAARAAAAKEKP